MADSLGRAGSVHSRTPPHTRRHTPQRLVAVTLRAFFLLAAQRRESFAELATPLALEEAQHTLIAAGHEHLPIRADGGAVDGVAPRVQHGQLRAGCHVPEANDLVGAA